jgi:hypothetical protein
MKKIINIILLSVILTSITNSCTNLDETLYSEVPVSEFGKDQTQVNALVGSIYSTLIGIHILLWMSFQAT